MRALMSKNNGTKILNEILVPTSYSIIISSFDLWGRDTDQSFMENRDQYLNELKLSGNWAQMGGKYSSWCLNG